LPNMVLPPTDSDTMQKIDSIGTGLHFPSAFLVCCYTEYIFIKLYVVLEFITNFSLRVF